MGITAGISRVRAFALVYVLLKTRSRLLSCFFVFLFIYFFLPRRSVARLPVTV